MEKIEDDLVYLYKQSQSEYTKDGKLSMEIGSSREKDLIAILHHYMRSDVEYNVGIHSPEDVKICGQNFSIKHSSSRLGKGSIKLKWTSDTQKAEQFKQQLMTCFTDNYYCNMLLVYVDNKGRMISIIGIMKETIVEGVKQFKESAFISRFGVNNRGVEFSPLIIKYVIEHASFKITLNDINLTTFSDPIQKRIQSLQQKNSCS